MSLTENRMTNQWGNSCTELDFQKHWSAINVQQEVLRGIELREQKPKTNEIEYDFYKIPRPSCSKSPDRALSRRHKTRKVTKKTRLKHTEKDRHCPLRVVQLAEPSKRHCLNTWKNKGHTLPDYMVDRLRRHVMDETPVVRISEAVNYFKKRKKLSKKSSPIRSKPKSENTRRDFNMTLSALFALKIAKRLTRPVNIVLNEELQNINEVVIDEISRILRPKNKKGSNPYKNDKILHEMANKVTVWIANILEETSYKQLLEELEELEEKEGPVLDILDELLESVMVTCKAINSYGSILSTDATDNDSISTLFSKKKTEDGNESNSDFGMSLDKDEIRTENDEKNHDEEILAYHDKSTIEEQLQRIIEEKINDIFDDIDITEDNYNIVTGEKSNLYGETNTGNDITDLNQTMENHDYFQSHISNDYVGRDGISMPGQTNDGKNLASNIAQDFIGPVDTTMPRQTINENNLASNIAQDYIGTDDTSIPGQTNEENNLPSNIAQDYISTDDTTIPGQMSNENNLPSNIVQDYNGTQDTIMPEQNKTIDITVNTPAEDIDEQKKEQHEMKIPRVDGIKLSLEDLDEETKKVKFSDINMENGDKRTEINKNASEFKSDYKAPVTWKSSKDYILSHFNVAPPNPNLLSYIDEVWPEYTLPPLLKATESVIKSVSSLGRILEADENIQSPIQKLPKKSTEKVFNKQLNTAIINLTGEGVSENCEKTSDIKDVEKSEKDINKHNKLIEDIQGHDQSLLEQLSKHFATDEDDRPKLHKHKDFQIKKTIAKNEETVTDRRTEHDRHSSLDKHSIKKVQKTEILPSQGMHVWKKPTLQERGDIERIKSNISVKLKIMCSSANNTIMTVDKNIQTSLEIRLETDDFCFESNEKVRKWCMGLQNVTENLELGTAWIQNVCLNITYLKYEGMALNNDFLRNKHIRKWIDLKKNIDLDVQQWSKLRRSLRLGLQTYKSSYHSRETALMQANNKCECKKHSQKNLILTSCIKKTTDRTIRKV